MVELFQLPKRTLYHPPPGPHRKGMKRLAFNHLNFRSNKYFHGSGEVFTSVPAVTLDFLHFCQVWGAHHFNRSIPVSHVCRGHPNRMGQAIGINGDV
jgi:hypothetical protein